MTVRSECPGCGATWPDFDTHGIQVDDDEGAIVCGHCFRALQRAALRLLERVKPQLRDLRAKLTAERTKYEDAARAFQESYTATRRQAEEQFAEILLREVPGAGEGKG